MPRNLRHWTQCAPAGKAISRSSAIADIILTLIAGFFVGASVYGVVMHIIAVAVGQTIGLGCIFTVGILIAVIAGIIEFIDWYDNRRLMCIKHDQCLLGVVVDKPKIYEDGDTALNLMLAPFSPKEHGDALLDVIEEKRLAGANYPPQADLNTSDKLLKFLQSISQTEILSIYQTAVHTRLLDTTKNPGKDFQRRYFIKTPALDEEIPGTFSAIADDSLKPGGATNPMFRCPWDDKNKRGGFEHPYPYLHAEIEGHYTIAWLENIRDGLIAGTLAFAALCAICTFASGGSLTFLCGAIGAGAAAVIAFFAWLFKHVTNKPSSQTAKKPGVIVEDPDFAKPPSTATEGSIVVVFGDWVMDMEHDFYFEIHPVKAWYLLCRGASTGELKGFDLSRCAFITKMTKDDFDKICNLVLRAEGFDPPGTIKISGAAGVSMLGGIR